MINFACPTCTEDVRCADGSAGDEGDCPHCGRAFVVPYPGAFATVPMTEAVAPAKAGPTASRVVLVDVDMPLASMVRLQFKWALASVPLAVAMAIVYAIFRSVGN